MMCIKSVSLKQLFPDIDGFLNICDAEIKRVNDHIKLRRTFHNCKVVFCTNRQPFVCVSELCMCVHVVPEKLQVFHFSGEWGGLNPLL